MASNVKTIFQWLNNDSTADLNKRFATVFHKGISAGGNLNTVSTELSIIVNPYEAMTENGLLLVSDLDYKFTNIPLNQMTVFTIFGKWIMGDAPVVEYRTYEINEYNSLTNKGDHIVFGTVTLGSSNLEVLNTDISYDIRDVFDKLGRSSFRGSVVSAVNLPAVNNREGDFYSVGGGGGLVEIYAWNGSVWLNVTNTLALQNQLTDHRNNAYINEKHLTDNEKDAALGTVGIPSGSNRYVTNQDPRVPSQGENDALAGTGGVPSATNKYVTEEYPIAEVNYLVYPLAPGTLSMIAIPGKYVGNGGVGSANTYFSLMDVGIDRGYINSLGYHPKIVDIFKNSLLTVKLDPSVDADSTGFYDGDLYITVDNVIDTGVRLAYNSKKFLNNIGRGFSSKKGPSADYVSGEARQYIQNIKGRDYDVIIPDDEKNINLRNDIDGLVSYLGSNQKISIVAGKEDFEYFKADTKLGPSFIENINLAPKYTYQNSALTGFTYDSTTGVVTYLGTPDLTSVVNGNLFRDGLGNYFKVVSKTTTTVTIVDIATNQIPLSSPNTSVSVLKDGSITVNNNPRNVLVNELKANAHEIIRFDKLVSIEELSIPEGREAFGIIQDSKRINPRIVVYGSWENYTDPETYEEYIRNTTGIGDIQITGFISEVYLLCKPKPLSPTLSISLNGEQASSTVDISSGGKANATNIEGQRFSKILIKNALNAAELNTINMRIQSVTTDPLVICGLEIISFPSANPTVTNEVMVEAGVGFKSTKLANKTVNDVVSIPAINKYGVNYQVVLDRNIDGSGVVNVVNTPVPEMDFYPTHPTSTSYSGASFAVTDPNARLFKVNDLIQLIGGSKAEIRKLISITGNTFTFDSATTQENKSFRLLCSLGDDTPFDTYNSYAAKYNLINDFINFSKTDFSLNNSGTLANRYVVHKDGQTIVGAKNANVSEDRNTVIIPTTGSLDIGVFGPKLALEFNNATAATVQISIDGSLYYDLTLPAGRVRKTLFTKARNTFHEIHIKSSTSSFEVTDLIIYSIERGKYDGTTLLATIDNVAPYVQQMGKDETLYRYSSGKVFHDAYHYGQLLNGTGVNQKWNVAYASQFLGRYVTTQNDGDSINFTFTGEGFEILALMDLMGGKAKVLIDGVSWDLVAGITSVPAITSPYIDFYGSTSVKVFAVYGLSYTTHTVTIVQDNPRTAGGSGGYSVGILGYSVLSIGGKLRNTYNNDAQLYTPVWDSRDFASSGSSFGQVVVGTSNTKASTGTSFSANQTAHGFSVLTPIYHNGVMWKKAQANSGDTLAVYVVTKASTDSFTAVKFGLVKILNHGLVAGEFYYTSSDTAGVLTDIEPMFGFSNPVLYVEDATKIHIMCHRPSAIGDGNVSDSEVSAIVAFPTNSEPAGFLYCDGRAVSRSIYSDLFGKINTRYGGGDGVNTFNLPDMRGWFLRGGVEVTSKTFAPANVTVASNSILIAAHQFRRSGFKVRFTSTTTLPSPLVANTDYFVIYIDDDNIKLATTLSNALAGTAIVLANQGTGTHTVLPWISPDEALRTGSAFGGIQDDQIKLHNHLQNPHNHLQDPHNHLQDPHTHTYLSQTGTTGSSGTVTAATGTTVNTSTTTATNQAATATNQAAGGNENRPQNMTVGFFIRYAPKGAIKGQSIPAGLIFNFGGASANVPNGYLLCDGSSLVRTDYPDLFNAIGTAWGAADTTHFNLPDGRGLFFRGVDGVAGRDPDKVSRTAITIGGNTGNNVGSLQLDMYGSHTHIQDPHTHGFSSSVVSNSSTGTNLTGAGTSVQSGATTATNQNSGGNETRPKNAYVNYIIKY